MKTLLLLCISSVLIGSTLMAQEARPEDTVIEIDGDILQEEEKDIYELVEQMPVFPGGHSAMFKYLSKNITYPQDAQDSEISGKVFVSFVIDTLGAVTNVQLMRGVNPSLNAEAVRVVEAMPNWTPGYQKGKAVKVQYRLPIAFNLDAAPQEKKKKKKKAK